MNIRHIKFCWAQLKLWGKFLALSTSIRTNPWPSNFTPGQSSPRNENLPSHWNLYMNVYSSFVQNSHEMGTTQISFRGWIVRLWYHGILFSNKKKIMVNAYNIQKIMWIKKPTLKDYLLYDSIYVTFLKLQNYRMITDWEKTVYIYIYMTNKLYPRNEQR